MANYAVQKAKYGGIVGTIHPFVSQLPPANDPNAGAFRSNLPAGFLRCDGSLLNASDYPALAQVLGVGNQSKFAKNRATILATQIQLPDLGSKYMIASTSSGTYLSLTLSDTTTSHIGAEFNITSNVGPSETISYSGNFTVPASNASLLGNPLYTAPAQTVRSILTDTSFQGHGHGANQAVFNYTDNYLTSTSTQGTSGGPGVATAGNECTPFGGNRFAIIAQPTGTTGTGASHQHDVVIPTSSTAYSHNMVYDHPVTQISAAPLRTEINITTSAVKTFDTTVAPFILVEYVIKF